MATNQPAKELQRRLDELTARLEIESALHDYSVGIDDRDPQRWLSAFHEDAVFDVDFPPAVLHGHQEILRWAQGVWEFQTISHLTGNHRITLVDTDTATGVGHGLGIFKLLDGAVILANARLEDRYARRDGNWKILRRKVGLVSSFRLNEVTDLILNGKVIGQAQDAP